jgi:hypothetical protein
VGEREREREREREEELIFFSVHITCVYRVYKKYTHTHTHTHTHVYLSLYLYTKVIYNGGFGSFFSTGDDRPRNSQKYSFIVT